MVRIGHYLKYYYCNWRKPNTRTSPRQTDLEFGTQTVKRKASKERENKENRETRRQ
jgi:hypothetical protein